MPVCLRQASSASRSADKADGYESDLEDCGPPALSEDYGSLNARLRRNASVGEARFDLLPRKSSFRHFFAMLRRGRGPSCASRGFGNLKIRLIEFVKECDLAFSENVNFSVCESLWIRIQAGEIAVPYGAILRL